MAGKTILLDRNSIRKVIHPDRIIDAMEDAVRAITGSLVPPPPKAIIDLSFIGESAFAAAITGHMGSGNYLSIKLGQERELNHKRDLPTTSSWMNLYNIRTGELLAISDGGLPTMLRTAAMAALSIRHMARQDSGTLTIVGAGGQLGQCCIQLCSTTRNFNRIHLVDSRSEEAEKAKNEWQGQVNGTLLISDAESACRESDVIVTATASRKPIVKKDWVKPGTHLACMGADMGIKIEVDPKLTVSAHIIADEPEHVIQRGEVSQSVENGLLGKDCFAGSIKEVVSGKVKGRLKDTDITLYDGVGVGYQDTAILSQIYEEASRNDVGISMGFS